MARIPETFNFDEIADKDEFTTEMLLMTLQRLYTDLAVAVNSKPDIYERATDGLTTDTFLSNGAININTTTLKVEMLTEHTTPTAVIWTTLG